jgi:hypothetical protein
MAWPSRYAPGVDPVLLYTLGGAFALFAIYFLFLRDSTMWGFIAVIGVVVVVILYYYPDVIDRTF